MIRQKSIHGAVGFAVLDIQGQVVKMIFSQNCLDVSFDADSLLASGLQCYDDMCAEDVVVAIQRPDMGVMRVDHIFNLADPVFNFSEVNVPGDALQKNRKRFAQVPDHVENDPGCDQYRQERVQYV